MNDRMLIRKAGWCGAVAGLLSMLIALNFIPIQSVAFLLTTRVVGSHERIAALARTQQELRQEPSQRFFLSVSPTIASNPPVSATTNLEATQVAVFAKHLVPPTELQDLLESGSQVEDSSTRELQQIAALLRQNQWKHESLLHSLSELEKELEAKLSLTRANSDSGNAWSYHPLTPTTPDAAEDPTSPLGRPVPNQVAEDTSNRVSQTNEPPANAPFLSASYHAQPEAVGELESLRDRLLEELGDLEEHLAQLRQNQLRMSDEAHGILEVTGDWKVRPIGGRVRLSQALGLIGVGLASWVAVAILYYWLARGRGANPRSVALWMERAGIPFQGVWSTQTPSTIREMKVDSSTSSVSHPASSPLTLSSPHFIGPTDSTLATHEPSIQTEPCFASIRLQRVLESTLMLMLVWAAIRFAVDPHWRLLTLDQPLAGLSRLFVGLG